MRTLVAFALLVFVALGIQAQTDLKAKTPRTADGKPDLSGLWQPNAKFNQNLAADLKPDAVPMTPWARALYDQRRANQGKDDPEGYCLSPGVPRVWGVPFPSRIIQTPGLMIVMYETRNTFRQIFTDGRSIAKDAQPTWMGYSTGKWDGDVLVVETKGFNDKTWLDDDGHPHSTEMRVIERFRRPDFGHMFIDITIEDSIAYSRPWTVTEDFKLDASGDLIEYICNENNKDIEHLVGK